MDTGRAELMSAQAAVAVAEADVTRAEAGVRTAQIRLQETEAARHLDVGGTVRPTAPASWPSVT